MAPPLDPNLAVVSSLHHALYDAQIERWIGCVVIPVMPGAVLGQARLSGYARENLIFASDAARNLADRLIWPV